MMMNNGALSSNANVAPEMAYHNAHAYPSSYCTCPDCTGYSYPVESGYSAAYDSPILPPTPLMPQTSVIHSYVHNPYSHAPASYCTCDECLRSAPPTYVMPAQQPMYHQPQQYHAPPAPVHSQARRTSSNVEKPCRVNPMQFSQIIGTMHEMARTAHGSSYIQACLRDHNQERFHAVCNEILPYATQLLLDTHGCYVVRTLMEQMSHEDLAAFVNVVAKEEAVVLALCTNSLHSRRIVQFFLDNLDAPSCEFLVDVMIKKCNEVSRTQQGCIVIQRVLATAAPDRKQMIFDLVQRNVVCYSMDPYANYVVQYMFEMGDKESNSQCVKNFFVGSVIQLATDKYASNVVEKALHFTTADAQHAIVDELYSVAPEKLVSMIQDSYGNYIIQATIALCSFRDVWAIAERLNPVLHMTPYGYKIASKLERRLKGKALTVA